MGLSKNVFPDHCPGGGCSPRPVIAIQTFGDFLEFNPHCHVLCTDGGFPRNRPIRAHRNGRRRDRHTSRSF
ncbi:MAG: transposase [Deltaproteobacteria bacterium]|nr:transposase [Deltaproteobacteria bacterium]